MADQGSLPAAALCLHPLPRTPSALQRLRGWDEVDEELEEIRREDEAERAAGFVSVRRLCSTRALRWQLITVVALMGGQQLSGVNAVRSGGKATRRGQGGGQGLGRGPCPAGRAPRSSAHACHHPLPDLLLRRPDLPECRREEQ